MATRLFPSITPTRSDPADLLEAGTCPWCDADSFESVKRHASAAHPDESEAEPALHLRRVQRPVTGTKHYSGHWDLTLNLRLFKLNLNR